jgi:hypothetical protein
VQAALLQLLQIELQVAPLLKTNNYLWYVILHNAVLFVAAVDCA